MTVNDLIKQLQAMSDEDRELTMVKWAPGKGGNTYSPMTMGDVCWYVTDSAWTGEMAGFDGFVPDRVLVWGM